MTKKVLITGGTGFLGGHLARLFLKKRYQVTIFDLAELNAKDLMGKVKIKPLMYFSSRVLNVTKV